MRVLQLIDSLHTGGAERVAVNIANALSVQIDNSFLCATRTEGLLKGNLADKVQYLFLNKKYTIDVFAIRRLYSYIKKQQIEIIHAHSTSFFLATLIKLLNRNVTIVWHDHYGNSEYLDQRKFKALRFCSVCFSHVLSVNSNLKAWAKEKLKSKKVSDLPNFAVIDQERVSTTLHGVADKRIICLANLRSQKDHFNLINAFKGVVKLYPEWTLHCVGKDFNDDYSKLINGEVEKIGLNNSIFFYGSKPDISNILNQCTIGVLASKSEGLPISLLEYGLAGLPVVVTDVGDCAKVVLHNECGIVVPKENPKELAKSILNILKNKERSNRYGYELKLRVQEEYSEAKYIKNLMAIYNSI
jgi:glycosyltransferase involved in cell wall biosynthesis